MKSQKEKVKKLIIKRKKSIASKTSMLDYLNTTGEDYESSEDTFLKVYIL